MNVPKVNGPATPPKANSPSSWVDQFGRQQTGIGYKGFNWRPYLEDFKVAPKKGPLPTIVRWTERDGKARQIHLRSSDVPALLKEIAAQGGEFKSMEQSPRGARWVPSAKGDY